MLVLLERVARTESRSAEIHLDRSTIRTIGVATEECVEGGQILSAIQRSSKCWDLLSRGEHSSGCSKEESRELHDADFWG